MSFVEIVLNLISQKGISKNKMLTDLHLSKNSIVDWGNRGTIPSGETLSKVAAYFNVTTDYLLGYEQKNKATTRHSDLINEALSIMNGLPKDRQDNAIALLRAMAALSDKTENK